MQCFIHSVWWDEFPVFSTSKFYRSGCFARVHNSFRILTASFSNDFCSSRIIAKICFIIVYDVFGTSLNDFSRLSKYKFINFLETCARARLIFLHNLWLNICLLRLRNDIANSGPGILFLNFWTIFPFLSK
jgi:uncharacterized membrane protein SirB2